MRMRLYTVENYGEYYFKSVRKPVFKEVRVPLRKDADEDIVSFVEDVVSVEGLVKSTLWVPEVELDSPERAGAEFTFAAYMDWSEVMNEILKRDWYKLHPISIEAWRQMEAWWNTWEGSDKGNPRLWSEGGRLWRLTWGNLDVLDKKAYAGRLWWEQVRAHEVWKEIYAITLRKYQKTPLKDMAPRYAKMTADYYVNGFLRGQVSVKDLEKAANLRVNNDYVGAFLGKLITYGVAILMKVALPLIVLTGVLVLVINPSSQGIRRKRYWESRLLMRYDSKLWWADIIGRSAKGKGVYMRCEEVKGEMVKRKVWGRGGVLVHEELLMEPNEIGTVREKWFYWVTWPLSFEVRFRGYLTAYSENVYRLQDRWSEGEVTPYELEEDMFGKLRRGIARWFNPRFGVPSMKDSELWCGEAKLPRWVFYEGEIPM